MENLDQESKSQPSQKFSYFLNPAFPLGEIYFFTAIFFR
jgi:hypothetical protein